MLSYRWCGFSLSSLFGILTLSSALVVQAKDYFPPPDSEGGWRTLTNAADIQRLAELDLAKLEQAFDFTQRCSQNGGLLVVRHGYLVFEKYFGRARRNANPDMASTGKAYTSIACGIMLQEFRSKIPAGLDTKVFTEKYLPEAFPLDDPRKAEITLGQLLCMTAGYHGEGASPGIVHGEVIPLKPVAGQDIKDLDRSSIRTVLWTNAGAGYSYSSPAPYNPHCPYTLMFENNSDGHVAGAPRDAFYKSGAGGFGLFVVPSLDMVIYKMGGNNGQYDPALTGLAQPFDYDASRDKWTPIPRTPFHEGSMAGDDGLRRVLEMISAAVMN